MNNYAHSLRKLTMTTAVTALLATPLAVQAQTADLGADVAAGANAEASGAPLGVTADVDSTVAAEGELTSDAEVAETLPTATDTDVDVALDGSTLAVGSDDTVLGTISGAEPQADGSVRYSIDLAEDLAVDSPQAVVQIEQDLNADGQLVIGMTGEEFATALTQQAEAAQQTQTN